MLGKEDGLLYLRLLPMVRMICIVISHSIVLRGANKLTVSQLLDVIKLTASGVPVCSK